MGIVSNKYHIKFFSVGDSSKGGDAILIELFDEGDNPLLILIDGGYQETGNQIVKYVKEKYPNNLRFDFIFNTHPDLDHISGIKVILEDEDMEVGALVMNRPWKDAGFTRQNFADNRITNNSLLNRIKEILKDKEFEIFVLHAVNDYTFEEIAKLKHRPLGTILWSYNNAIKKIQKELADEIN